MDVRRFDRALSNKVEQNGKYSLAENRDDAGGVWRERVDICAFVCVDARVFHARVEDAVTIILTHSQLSIHTVTLKDIYQRAYAHTSLCYVWLGCCAVASTFLRCFCIIYTQRLLKPMDCLSNVNDITTII